jgi:ATP-dependent Clp endopeptidase proteolytic subunit ClpP
LSTTTNDLWSISDVVSCLSHGVYPPSRTIMLTGEVDEDMARRTIMAMHLFDEVGERIRVIINSGGGSVCNGLAIYDALKAAKGEVVTIATGRVDSMAGIIFQAGDQRLMTPNSRLMIHSSLSSHSLDYIQFQEREVVEARKQKMRFGKIMATKLGLTPEEFWGLYENTVTYYSPQQCVELGLADGITGEDG